MRTSRGWSSLDISLFAMLTVVGRFLVVDCQFVTEGDDLKTLCRPGQECRLISRCPAVLKLVLKVKSGDLAAREKLLKSTCGFEKSLPKVCCGETGTTGTTDRPRIFQNSNTVPTRTRAQTKADPSPFTTTASTTASTTTTTTTKTTTTITTITTTTDINTTTSSARNFSSLNSPTCGTRKDVAFRITLGEDAMTGQFPWLGSLIYRNQRGQAVPLCGATLISRQHLISAAHCDSSQSGYSLSSVRLGQVDLSTPVEFPGLEVNIRQILSHPRYTNNPVAIYDIAIVIMDSPVTFTDMIRPICVFQDEEVEEVEDVGEELVVAGWGRTERGLSSAVLQFTRLREVRRPDCQAEYRLAGSQGRLGPLTQGLDILPSQVCARGDGGSDSCSGDSGGPLMLQTAGPESRWFLTGVVSFGTNECDSSLPGVYTDTTAFYHWIQDITQNSHRL